MLWGEKIFVAYLLSPVEVLFYEAVDMVVLTTYIIVFQMTWGICCSIIIMLIMNKIMLNIIYPFKIFLHIWVWSGIFEGGKQSWCSNYIFEQYSTCACFFFSCWCQILKYDYMSLHRAFHISGRWCKSLIWHMSEDMHMDFWNSAPSILKVDWTNIVFTAAFWYSYFQKIISKYIFILF